MVTNYGLEAQKTTNPLLSGGIYAFGFNQVAVGTGSNAPAATDTSLQTEVARLNIVHGTDSTVVERVANSYTQIKTTLARRATFSASYTLREFGFFSTSATNTCMYRQLFRQDPNNLSSTPITIQVYAYDTLIITYTVIWRIDVSYTAGVGYATGTFTHPAGNGTLTLFPIADADHQVADLLKPFHPYPSWTGATTVICYLYDSAAQSFTINSSTDRTTSVYKWFDTPGSAGVYNFLLGNQTVTKTAAATGTYSTTLKVTFGREFGHNSINARLLLVSVGPYVPVAEHTDSSRGITTFSVNVRLGLWITITGRRKTSTQTWTLEWTLSWAAI